MTEVADEARIVASSMSCNVPESLAPALRLRCPETITGATCSVTLPVNVPSLPVASFTLPLSVCKGSPVIFTNTSSPLPQINSFLWDFDIATIGSPTSNEVSPTYTYNSPGVYNVSLSLIDIYGCNSTAINSITVLPNSTGTITGGPLSFCQGGSVTLTAPSGMSWNWSNNETTQSIVVSQSGNYSVTVTNTNGCSYTTPFVTITVNPFPVANTGNNVSLCTGTNAALGTASINGHTYSWQPTSGLSSGVVSNPVASPAMTTVYTLTETITATGCSKTNTVTVTVNPLPAANTGSNATICSGGSVAIGGASVLGNTYSWSPSAGLSSTIVSNPMTNPIATTTYVVTETITATGCSKSNSVTVTVNPLPLAVAGSDVTICSGNSAVLGTTNISGHTYLWSPSTGLSSSTVSSPVATPVETTTYTITETITGTSCSKSNTVTVTVNPLPTANAGNNVSICLGSSTSIGASLISGSSYSWSPSTGLSSSIVSNPVATPTVTTTYVLTETVLATGCSKSNSVTVTINPRPSAKAGSDVSICSGSSVLIGAASVSGDTYSWSPATGLSSTTVSNPTASPTETTTYTLTETITTTGCSKSNTVKVTLNPLPAANAGISTAICFGGSTVIGASTVLGNTYSWQPTSGLSSAVVSNPVASPAMTTTYTLTETITATGCSKSNTVTVNVNLLPAANAGIDKTICSGGSTTIGGATVVGNTYSWSPSTGLSSTIVSNPTANPTSTTT